MRDKQTWYLELPKLPFPSTGYKISHRKGKPTKKYEEHCRRYEEYRKSISHYYTIKAVERFSYEQ